MRATITNPVGLGSSLWKVGDSEVIQLGIVRISTGKSASRRQTTLTRCAFAGTYLRETSDNGTSGPRSAEEGVFSCQRNSHPLESIKTPLRLVSTLAKRIVPSLTLTTLARLRLLTPHYFRKCQETPQSKRHQKLKRVPQRSISNTGARHGPRKINFAPISPGASPEMSSLMLPLLMCETTLLLSSADRIDLSLPYNRRQSSRHHTHGYEPHQY
jgi:hypothetical protein